MAAYEAFTRQKSSHSDAASYARSTPVTTEMGIINYSGLKEQTLVLRKDGHVIYLQCSVYTPDLRCLNGRIDLPSRVYVSYVKYKNYNLILDLRDDKNSVVLSRSERLQDLEKMALEVRSRTPEKFARQGFLTGIIVAAAFLFFKFRFSTTNRVK